ncbi:unnamed protein product [Parnassius apollo]|uniref:(apollo) hypothetical protein n=1 Tax=Parnassius apollo TaxID=110799 RepID=A0A8S3Y6P3_PARAO|nr:unnamed protein product [Parnassius apollo]
MSGISHLRAHLLQALCQMMCGQSRHRSTDPMFRQDFAKNAMTRNRFEILLRMLHFSNNEETEKSDRLHKIDKLVKTLNMNFQAHFIPNESLCVDESLIPFRGRIIFRQYLKQKRHKYGIKIFKLCTTPGYTFRLEIYAGKSSESKNNTPTNIVLNLCSNLLNKGHTMYTDNWYSSVDLADKLLDSETHLVGMLRKNRKRLPKEVTETKLKPGEYISRETQRGITVMKLRDKREVLLLSTKYSNILKESTSKRGIVTKNPKIILPYNQVKSAVDLSDQMSAYSTPLRKTVKWYRKHACEYSTTQYINCKCLSSI